MKTHRLTLQSLPYLRAAINAQLALWDALRALEKDAGEGENPSWDELVQTLAIECDESADELSDDALTDALAELPPATD